jgi:glycosyltransferase involved in cell wall biosynthesis
MASGLEVVLRAGEILRDRDRNDICFLLIGDGANRDHLQSEAERIGLDNVIFTGRIDKEQVPAVLAEVDACLVHLLKTDLFETVIPSKIFEAAAMQKPIVLGVGGYATELVEEAEAGICIEPENEDELVSAVERLCENPNEAERLGAAGRALVRRRFNYDLLARSYLDILADVVD